MCSHGVHIRRGDDEVRKKELLACIFFILERVEGLLVRIRELVSEIDCKSNSLEDRL